MRLAHCLSAFTALTLTGSAAFAAATPEQAQAIRTALEKYLGKGSGPDQSPVTVTPDGERYAVDVNIKRVFHALEPLGVTLEPASYRVALTPQDGGTWRVTNDGATRFTAKFGERTVSIVLNGGQFDGLFDPALPAFTRSTSSYDSMSIAGTGGRGETQVRDTKQGKITYTAEVAGDGIINGRTVQTSAESTQEATVDAGPHGDSGKAPPRISMKSGPTTDEGTVEELRVRPLMDLWAFFVAHTSEADLRKDQEQLRTLLRSALPLFKHLSQSAAVEKTSVESPLGTFAAQAASLRLDLNGLMADGRVSSAIKVDTLSIPSGLVPPWAEGLVPTQVAVSEALTGFHLDTVAKKVVDSFDLNGAEPLPPGVQADLQTLVGPLDQLVLTVAPSRLTSALLDAKFEGQVRWTQPTPDVHMKVALSGMDKAIKDIQSKGGADEHAKQLVAVMLLAKGFGKAEPDGSITWDITPDPTGGFLVNGVALPFGR